MIWSWTSLMCKNSWSFRFLWIPWIHWSTAGFDLITEFCTTLCKWIQHALSCYSSSILRPEFRNIELKYLIILFLLANAIFGPYVIYWTMVQYSSDRLRLVCSTFWLFASGRSNSQKIFRTFGSVATVGRSITQHFIDFGEFTSCPLTATTFNA